MYKKIIGSEKIRFIVVGCGASLVHLVSAESIVVLNTKLSIYSVNLISFFLAFLFSYIGHRFFTFAKEGSLLKFFLTAILGFFINNIILSSGIYLGLDGNVAIFIAIMIVPAVTFLLSKYWVFKLIVK